MNHPKPAFGISGSTLKLIAIVTMLIDHTGATVLRAILRHPAVTSQAARQAFWLSVYEQSRSIGRIAFPIFCFLLVEGFLHTRNVRRYASRLFLFALISEIPFDIALKGSWYFPAKQNVYFTLLIGLLVLWLFSEVCHIRPAAGANAAGNTPPTPDSHTIHANSNSHDIDAAGNMLHSSDGSPADTTAAPDSRYAMDDATSPKSRRAAFLRLCLVPVILGGGMYLALRIDTDYNYKGIFLIAVLYLLRESRLFQCIGGAAGVAWELPAPLAFIPVYLYNGTRGLRMKYFFYWFYPVHLLALYVIAQYLIPLMPM